MRAHPWDRIAWETLRTACANLQQVVGAGRHAYFKEYIAETERLLANNDLRGFYRHLKRTVGWEGKTARSEQFIRDEDGTLELDPKIIDQLFPPRLLEVSLGDEPSMDEMMEVIKGMPNWKAVGPDGLPADVLKLDHPEDAQCFHSILVDVWITEEVPNYGNMRSSRFFINRKIALIATISEIFRLTPMQARYCWKLPRPALTTVRRGEYSLGNSVASVPHDQQPTCCSSCVNCRASIARTRTREETPCIHVLHRLAESVRLSTESCCWMFKHASAY